MGLSAVGHPTEVLRGGKLRCGAVGGGMPHSGMFWGGTLRGGVLHGGMCHCGVLHHGVLHGGMCHCGVLHHGIFHHGMFHHEVLHHGMLQDGMLHVGMFQHEMFHAGLLHVGTFHHGALPLGMLPSRPSHGTSPPGGSPHLALPLPSPPAHRHPHSRCAFPAVQPPTTLAGPGPHGAVSGRPAGGHTHTHTPPPCSQSPPVGHAALCPPLRQPHQQPEPPRRSCSSSPVIIAPIPINNNDSFSDR